MFDSAQSKYKPVTVNEPPAMVPPTPPQPPVTEPTIPTPPPVVPSTPLIDVPPMPQTQPVTPMPPMPPVTSVPPPVSPINTPPPITAGLPEVYVRKPFHHRMRFLLPAGIVLLTMALVAYVVSQNVWKPTTEQNATPEPSLTPTTPVPTPKVDLKAKWKSYINRDIRLQFRYPETLALTEDTPNLAKKRIVMKSDTDSKMMFTVIVGLESQLPSLLSTYTTQKEQLSNPSETEFQIADVPGMKVEGTLPGEGEGIPYTYGYVSLEGTVYLFISQDGGTLAEQDPFDAFVETVRFLPAGISEDWKTFENTNTNYSFRYPPSWEVVANELTATSSAGRIIARKVSGETEYQNLIIDTSIQTGQQKIELTASQVVSSFQNLSGWKARPTLDFRNIGGASAQIVSGEIADSYQMYVVMYSKNILIQMAWKDSVTRAEQETVDNILSTFKFTK